MRGYPRRYLVYDTETREIPRLGMPGTRDLVFRLGCAVYHELPERSEDDATYFSFRSTDQFHDFVGAIPLGGDPIYIFAHNHGFDSRIVGFYDQLAQGTYTLMPPKQDRRKRSHREPLFVIDGPPFLLRLYRPDGQELLLYDTMNWLDCSLAQVGEMLGYPKGSVDFRAATDIELADYCRRDVEITHLALRKIWGFCRGFGVKDWRPTVASQAHQSFRLRYGKGKIQMPEDHEDFGLDRHAYYGGRNECFQLGRIEGPIIQTDVNSMYPSLMKDSLFPVEILEKQHECKTPTEGAPSGPGQVTAEVWLESPDTAYPVRCRDGVWYCRGKVRTILCGPELRRACESGHVRQYGRWTRYRMSRIFTSYVQDLWAVRVDAHLRGEALPERLAKGMMNSLYGKFGEQGGDWVSLGDDYQKGDYGKGCNYAQPGQDPIDWRVIDGLHQRRRRDQLTDHSFVPIAAYVTSYGRVFMDAVRSKLWEDGIYYQATDSLLVDTGNWEMLDAAHLCGPDELGKFRKEDTHEWIDVRNVHQVDRPRKPLRGPIPSAAAQPHPGVYEYDLWEGPWTGIVQGRASCVSLEATLRRLRGTYARQEVLASGRCRPWAISNWHLTPEEQRRGPISHQGD
jgi:hypothetical protein